MSSADNWNISFGEIEDLASSLFIYAENHPNNLSVLEDTLNDIQTILLPMIQRLKNNYPVGQDIGTMHTYNELIDFEDEIKERAREIQNILERNGGMRKKRIKTNKRMNKINNKKTNKRNNKRNNKRRTNKKN